MVTEDITGVLDSECYYNACPTAIQRGERLQVCQGGKSGSGHLPKDGQSLPGTVNAVGEEMTPAKIPSRMNTKTTFWCSVSKREGVIMRTY